jgi:anti-sigma factor RsiW
MMKYQDQLKLQAYLDGELPEREADEVANWLARDQGAVALLAEMRGTRQAVTGFEKRIRLPESREFYWSKIQREIERLEPRKPAPPVVPFLVRLRRLLMPVSAVAMLAIAGFLAMRGLPGTTRSSGEISLADSGALTYRDYAAGATLVWLSYPADDELVVDEDSFTFQ